MIPAGWYTMWILPISIIQVRHCFSEASDLLALSVVICLTMCYFTASLSDRLGDNTSFMLLVHLANFSVLSPPFWLDSARYDSRHCLVRCPLRNEVHPITSCPVYALSRASTVLLSPKDNVYGVLVI